VVDAGGSLVVRDVLPGSPGWPQALVKTETVASALSAAGIDAMAVGGRDWYLGVRKVIALQQADDLPILAANLVCDGKRPFPASKKVTVAGHTVGFIGLTSGSVDGCTVEPLAEATRRAVDALGPVDALVALAPVETKDMTAIGKAAPEIDFVLDGHSGRRLDTPERSGPAWWLAHGFRGQNIGLVGLDFTGDSGRWVETGRVKDLEERITRFQQRKADSAKAAAAAKDETAAKRLHDQVAWYDTRIAEARKEQAALGVDRGASTFTWTIEALGAEVGDDPATAKLVAAAKERIGKVEVARPIVLGARSVDAGAYVGSDACKACHAAEYAQWSGTKHARAFDALQSFDRSMDRQCVGCHVTGWAADGGPDAPARVGPYRDVQCEACHGPGRAHVADPTGAKLLADPGVKTCHTCYDGVQDQGRFDADTYLPKVAHGAEAPAVSSPPPPPRSPR